MRKIRVKKENAVRFAEKLNSLGYETKIVKLHDTTWCGGCSDPGCCPQHESYYFPEKWVSLETAISGTKFNKLLEGGVL